MKRTLLIAVVGTLMGMPLLAGCDSGRTTTERTSETVHGNGATSTDKSVITTDTNGNVSKTTVHQSNP